MSVLIFLLLLLSLGVHNHVDDYSGTFGTVTAQARDTKVSTVVASTASLEREFQSLMVPGKKEPPLYCVLVVMRLSC